MATSSPSKGHMLGVGGKEVVFQEFLNRIYQENDRVTSKNTLQTLLTLTENAIKNPDDEKFHKVRFGNKAFHVKVWRFPAAQQFMLECGWVKVGDHLELPLGADLTLARQALQRKLSFFPMPKKIVEDKPNEAVLEAERLKREERAKQEKLEKERLKAQIKADREEMKERKMRSSKAQHLSHKGMTKYKDVGVDLSKGGG